MSTPITVKRRRLNEASRALSKPFVSPLHVPSRNKRTTSKQEEKAVDPPNLSSTPGHTVNATSDSSVALAKRASPGADAAKSTPVRKFHSLTSSARHTDPAEIAASRVLTTLELQIKALGNELDTLNQAIQLIASSAKDAELEALTNKWRLTSQQAAEELFGNVKERVCRMGGVQAWRESERKKHERANGLGEWAPEPEEDDDADCEFDSQGEELPKEEQEFRKVEKKRLRQEVMDAADLPGKVEEDAENGKLKVWQEPGSDDDSFTMDMMLRSLNIDIDVIRYDKEAQRWIQ